MNIDELAEEMKDLINRGMTEGVHPTLAANLVLYIAFRIAANHHGDGALGALDLLNGAQAIVKQHGGDVVH